jgi:hypothetical protein
MSESCVVGIRTTVHPEARSSNQLRLRPAADRLANHPSSKQVEHNG